MTFLYNTHRKTQAQNNTSYVYVDENSAQFSKNELNYKENLSYKKIKKNITYFNQSQRIDNYLEFSKPGRKRYELQVIFYNMVGVGNTRLISLKALKEAYQNYFGYMPSEKTIVRMTNILQDRGILEKPQTRFRKDNGTFQSGWCEYTLHKVDPIVHSWAEDKPFLPVGQNMNNKPSTSSFNTKRKRITISKTTSFSSNDSIEEVKKQKQVRKHPEQILDPKKWWPSGNAEIALSERFGNSYLAQEPIINEYQHYIAHHYPDGLSRREINYKFIPFMKHGKEMREAHSKDYVAWHMRKEYKENKPQSNKFSQYESCYGGYAKSVPKIESAIEAVTPTKAPAVTVVTAESSMDVKQAAIDAVKLKHAERMRQWEIDNTKPFRDHEIMIWEAQKKHYSANAWFD
jgi:hypothetical protein